MSTRPEEAPEPPAGSQPDDGKNRTGQTARQGSYTRCRVFANGR